MRGCPRHLQVERAIGSAPAARQHHRATGIHANRGRQLALLGQRTTAPARYGGPRVPGMGRGPAGIPSRDCRTRPAWTAEPQNRELERLVRSEGDVRIARNLMESEAKPVSLVSVSSSRPNVHSLRTDRLPRSTLAIAEAEPREELRVAGDQRARTVDDHNPGGKAESDALARSNRLKRLRPTWRTPQIGSRQPMLPPRSVDPPASATCTTSLYAVVYCDV
jgi:hypothetical protein